MWTTFCCYFAYILYYMLNKQELSKAECRRWSLGVINDNLLPSASVVVLQKE